MQQILFGGNADALSSSATEYNNISGGTLWSGTESYHGQVVAAPGTIDRLFVELSAAPGAGAGDAYVFTLRLNGADTALTCTITQPATSASDTTHTVAVVAGDVVTISCAPANGPSATPKAQWAMRFTSTNAKESLILGEALAENSYTTYVGVSGGTRSVGPTTEADAYQVCAAAGTIKSLYVALSADPGTSPDAYTFTLNKNGDPTELTCTITADDKTGNDTAHTVTVAAGDVLTLSIAPVSSPSSSPGTYYGMCFVADADGESPIFGGSANALSSAATEYVRCAAVYYGDTFWNATETDRQQLGLACVLKDLYIKLSDSPGAGKSYAFTLRNNAGATTLTATVADANTTASDTAHDVTIADGDNISLEVVPTSTPTVRDAYWGMVCYIAPAATFIPRVMIWG